MLRRFFLFSCLIIFFASCEDKKSASKNITTEASEIKAVKDSLAKKEAEVKEAKDKDHHQVWGDRGGAVSRHPAAPGEFHFPGEAQLFRPDLFPPGIKGFCHSGRKF